MADATGERERPDDVALLAVSLSSGEIRLR